MLNVELELKIVNSRNRN